jgi:surface antigen
MKKLLAATMTCAALALSFGASAQDYGAQNQGPPTYDNGGNRDRDYDRRDNDRDYTRGDEHDRWRAWRRHYGRQYTYNDDVAYTQCRNKADPAGVLAGAILGGILGNAVSHQNAGPTVAGVVAGGAAGAALTSDMDCSDRSYSYRAYSHAFNANRADAVYHWNNPDNDDHGMIRVLDYYHDEDGFKCAVFWHNAVIDGREDRARGRACRQPNGIWAIID